MAAQRTQRANRWKGRVYVRGEDGLRREVVRVARTRREAEAFIAAAVEAILMRSDVPTTKLMTLWQRGSNGSTPPRQHQRARSMPHVVQPDRRQTARTRMSIDLTRYQVGLSGSPST